MIKVSSDIKKQVMDKVEETLNIARAKYPTTSLPTPLVVFKQTGRRAGVCVFNFTTKICIIKINPDYFAKYHDDMINQTVPHEVAHYVSDMVYGRMGKGHGSFWKSVMRNLGRKPDRCHTYDLEGVKVKTVRKPFHYNCGCSEGHDVTPRLHLKMQMGRTYTCRKCRKKLAYSKNPVAPALCPVIPKPIEMTTFTVGKVVMASFPTPNPFPEVKPATPAPVPSVTYKTVTRFINGSLQNVRVPVEA